MNPRGSLLSLNLPPRTHYYTSIDSDRGTVVKCIFLKRFPLQPYIRILCGYRTISEVIYLRGYAELDKLTVNRVNLLKYAHILTLYHPYKTDARFL